MCMGEGRTKMEQDPFEDFSDLSGDDFRILNEATQFMRLSSAASANVGSNMSDVTMTSSEAQIQALKDQLARAVQKVDQLERNILHVQQERYTKEGEAAILRERLVRLEKERTEMLAKSNDRLQQSEQSRQNIEQEYRKNIDGLKAELMFKDQELESLSYRLDRVKIAGKPGASKDRRVMPVEDDVPAGFEDLSLVSRRRKRANMEPTEEILQVKLPVKEQAVPRELTPREVLDQAIEAVDYLRDISALLDYDYKEILRRKDEMYRTLSEMDSVLATIEIAYDSALLCLRQPIFIYFSRITAACLALRPKLAQDALSRVAYPPGVTVKYPEYSHCQLIPKMCKFLTNPLFGLHPWVLKAHLDAFKCCLAYTGHSVPLEIKDLIEIGAILPKCLNNCLDKDDVLLDFVQLMALMSSDRSAVALLLRSNPEPVGASMLAILVKVGMNRFRGKSPAKEAKSYDVILLALTEYLLMLGSKNIVPLHVAFDWRFLREMIQYLASHIWQSRLDLTAPAAYSPFIEALHFVFVQREEDLWASISGSTFSLHYIAEQVVTHAPSESRAHMLAVELMRVTVLAAEAWVKEKDAARMDNQISGPHLTIPIDV